MRKYKSPFPQRSLIALHCLFDFNERCNHFSIWNVITPSELQTLSSFDVFWVRIDKISLGYVLVGFSYGSPAQEFDYIRSDSPQRVGSCLTLTGPGPHGGLQPTWYLMRESKWDISKSLGGSWRTLMTTSWLTWERSQKRSILLDFVLTNKKALIRHIKVEGSLGCSDHKTMELRILRGESTTESKITVFDFRKADFDYFKDLFSIFPGN